MSVNVIPFPTFLTVTLDNNLSTTFEVHDIIAIGDGQYGGSARVYVRGHWPPFTVQGSANELNAKWERLRMRAAGVQTMGPL